MIATSKILIAVAALGIGAVAATTALNETSIQEVAGHRFEIPEDHLFTARIFFLPESDSDAFTFLFEPNPDTNTIPKHRVLVQDLSRFCPTELTTDGTQMLRLVCGQEKSAVAEAPPFFELGNNLGSWSSDLYSGKPPSASKDASERRKVAYCQRFDPNPVKPKLNTLCTTFWAYEGLMLQFSFDAKESEKMPAMKRHAEELLELWELR